MKRVLALIIIVCVCFVITPVFAGNHPIPRHIPGYDRYGIYGDDEDGTCKRLGILIDEIKKQNNFLKEQNELIRRQLYLQRMDSLENVITPNGGIPRHWGD